MKTKNKLGISAVLAAVFGLLVQPVSVFAYNPYGIEYSGGEALGSSNVQINPTLINELTTLVKMDKSATLEFNDPNSWESGWLNDGETGCLPVKYFRKQNPSGALALLAPVGYGGGDYSFVISRGAYREVIRIDDVYLENFSEGDSVAIVVWPEGGFIYASNNVYTDSQCETAVDGLTSFYPLTDNKRVFIEANVKLYKEGNSSVFTSDQLYFGITDIDYAQSFMILNSDNLFSTSNMYAKSADVLNGDDPSNVLKNRFVASGNYIYSEYDGTSSVISGNNSNIFVKLTQNTQEQGVQIVLGFAKGAGSQLEYYAKQYKISYISDENGVISGISAEDIITGDYPSGSSSKPEANYRFMYWVANKDVTLNDGTVIKAGEPMTLAQTKQIVVNEDIILEAIHEDQTAVPNTGAFTGETNAMAISVSIMGILLGALVIRSLPKLNHKKIDFKK